MFTRLTKMQRFSPEHLPRIEVTSSKLATLVEWMSSWGIPPIASVQAWGMFLSDTITAAAMAAGRRLIVHGEQSPVVGPVIRVENLGHSGQASPRKGQQATAKG